MNRGFSCRGSEHSDESKDSADYGSFEVEASALALSLTHKLSRQAGTHSAPRAGGIVGDRRYHTERNAIPAVNTGGFKYPPEPVVVLVSRRSLSDRSLLVAKNA